MPSRFFQFVRVVEASGNDFSDYFLLKTMFRYSWKPMGNGPWFFQDSFLHRIPHILQTLSKDLISPSNFHEMKSRLQSVYDSIKNPTK